MDLDVCAYLSELVSPESMPNAVFHLLANIVTVTERRNDVRTCFYSAPHPAAQQSLTHYPLHKFTLGKSGEMPSCKFRRTLPHYWAHTYTRSVYQSTAASFVEVCVCV